MKRQILSHSTTIILIIMLILFSISYAILIPIIFRPFYYCAVKILNIEKESGYSFKVIREAYDDVMNFIWHGDEFKTGTLLFSEEGKSHFKDCVPLFWLDLWVCIVSFVYILVYFILIKLNKLEMKKYKGFHPLFYAGAIVISLVVIISLISIINFDLVFKAFHKIFFHGKENWVFDEETDEIINILPKKFMALCAAWIGIHIFAFDIFGIIYGIKKRKMSEENKENDLVSELDLEGN